MMAPCRGTSVLSLVDNLLLQRLLSLTTEAVLVVSPQGQLVGQSPVVKQLLGERACGHVGHPLDEWLQAVAGPAPLVQADDLIGETLRAAGQSLWLELAQPAEGPSHVCLSTEVLCDDQGNLEAMLVRLSSSDGKAASTLPSWALPSRLVEGLPLGVIAVDATGQPLWANALAYRLLGIPIDQLSARDLEHHVDVVLHPDETPYTSAEIQKLWKMVGGDAQGEVELGVIVDGAPARWLHINLQPQFENDCLCGMLLLLQDASARHAERQRLARRVKEQAAELQYIRGQAQSEHEAWARDTAVLSAQLDSTIEGVLVTGLGHEVLALNGRLRDLFNIPVVEGRDLTWEYVHRCLAAQFVDPVAFEGHVAAMFADSLAESLTWWELADGRWLVLHTLPVRREGDGRELGRIWAFRDITVNRMTAIRAEEQRKLFQAILDLMPANVSVRDEKGCYLLVNRAMARAYGSTVDQVLGKTDAELRVSLGRTYSTPSVMSQSDATITVDEQERAQFDLLADQTTGSAADYLSTKTEFTWPDGRRVVLGVSQNVSALRRAEQETIRRERQLQAVIDLLPAQVFVKDHAGRYVIANQSTAEFARVSLQALLGRTDAELAALEPHPDWHLDVIERTDSEVLSGNDQASYQAAHLDAKGKLRDYYVIKRPFEYDDKPAILGVGLDVTAQREAERRVQAQRNWFQQIFDFLPSNVFVRDADGRYVVANRSMASARHCSLADLIGRTDAELAADRGVDQDIVEQINAADRRILDGRSECEQYMLTMADPGGAALQYMVTQVPLALEDGSPAVLGVAMDITRAQEADLMEKQLELIYDSVPVGIALIDRSGTITRANRRLTEMLKVPIEAVEGYSLFNGASTRDLGITAQLANCLREGLDVVGETGAATIGPAHIRARYGLAARRDQHGHIVGALAIIEDITAYQRLQERLREAAKLEALGTLAGGMAHSFRNLLTVINGYTEMALLNRRLSSRLRQDLTQVFEAGQRAAELARQLLAFSRHNELELSVFDLNDVLRELALMLHPVLGEAVTLNMSLSKEPLYVRADRAQVEQMVINLTINARQAMPKGGTLSLKTLPRRFAKTGRTDYLDPLPGSYALFEVSDTGVGIGPEVRQHLFEPFFTTKPNGEGTGLGLSMVYGLVQGLGGGIDVRSVPGHGATFRVYLPRTSQQMVNGSASASPRLPRAKRGELVLVVDAHAEQHEHLRRILGPRLGYTVFDAESGAEALALCEELRERFDLLLTEVALPDMTGPELEAALRSQYGLRRAIYLTAIEQATLVARGEISADARFLAKPYEPERVARTLREVLDAPADDDAQASPGNGNGQSAAAS